MKKLKKVVKNLEDYIFPDFPDLRIYSNAFYREIISKKFYDCKSKDYTIMYADFNNLNELNKVKGKKIGNIALKDALKIIKQELPNNAIISRIGGDEFFIIIPNMEQEEAKNVSMVIKNKIFEKLNYGCNFGITFGVKDSTQGNNIDELEIKAERELLEKKKQGKIKNNISDKQILKLGDNKEELKKWEKLINTMDIAVKTHLSDIRISKDYKYQKEDCIKEIKLLDTIFKEFLNSNNKKNCDRESDKNITKTNNNIDISNSDNIISSIVFDAIEDKNMDKVLNEEELYKSENKIQEIIYLMAVDEDKLLSRIYLKNELINKMKENEEKYQMIYFSIVGIRTSNTALGHIVTDEKIKKTTQIIKNEIIEKVNLCKKPFNKFNKEESFFINLNGGNYVLFNPLNNKISENQIMEITNNINNKYEKDNLYGSFHIVAHSKNDLEISSDKQIFEEINKQNEECNNIKNKYKMAMVLDELNKEAFKNCMKDSFKFYIDNVPSFSDEKNIKTVASIYCDLLLNNVKNSQKVFEDNIEDSDDKNNIKEKDKNRVEENELIR